MSLSSRFGHQNAIYAGIENCESDWIIMLDADLQHPPELIPQFLREAEKGFDIVSGVRQRSNPKKFKILSSEIFYSLVLKLFNIQLVQNGPDFRLISSRVADVLRNGIHERNLFLRGLFSWVGFNNTLIQYSEINRKHGSSKYSFSRKINLSITAITYFSKYILRIPFIFGILFSSFGIFTTLYSILFFSKSGVHITLFGISFIATGLNFIFLSFIGEYIGAIFDETKRRPYYIIDERINI